MEVEQLQLARLRVADLLQYVNGLQIDPNNKYKLGEEVEHDDDETRSSGYHVSLDANGLLEAHRFFHYVLEYLLFDHSSDDCSSDGETDSDLTDEGSLSHDSLTVSLLAKSNQKVKDEQLVLLGQLKQNFKSNVFDIFGSRSFDSEVISDEQLDGICLFISDAVAEHLYDGVSGWLCACLFCKPTEFIAEPTPESISSFMSGLNDYLVAMGEKNSLEFGYAV